MDNQKLIDDLNKFLRGVHMGGTTFKDYLEKAQDNKLKQELRIILESFKKHEEMVTHRIENLGGDAADSVGLMGMMGEFFEKLKLVTIDSDKEVMNAAINALNMGVEQGNKFLSEHQDLTPDIKNELNSIVDDNDKHLMKLKNM